MFANHPNIALARIENAELVPMRTVPAELSRLDARTDVGTLIVFCHHGVRSLNVVNWLREQGVDACQSMAGGIDLWSLEIDPVRAALFPRPSAPVRHYLRDAIRSSSWSRRFF